MSAAEHLPDPPQPRRHWKEALLAYFLRRVHNRAEAEDLTQDVLLRLLSSSKVEEVADGYVFRIARNLLVDRARHKKIIERFGVEERRLGLTNDEIDPFRVVSARMSVDHFLSALEKLPAKTRNIYILFKLENISQVDISRAYSISVSAVKKHIARAHAYIIEEMRDDA